MVKALIAESTIADLILLDETDYSLNQYLPPPPPRDHLQDSPFLLLLLIYSQGVLQIFVLFSIQFFLMKQCLSLKELTAKIEPTTISLLCSCANHYTNP